MTSLRRRGLGRGSWLLKTPTASVQMQQATHTVTQWPWGRRQTTGRWLHVDCRHTSTQNSVHAAVLPVSFPVWRKAMRSRAEARVHSPSVAPEPGILSPLLSCYLDRCCIYVFTWCLYDIYTYFLGMWGLTFTVPRAALGSDTEQAAEVWRRLLSALATGQGETVAGRGGSGSKWRKAGRRKPYDVNQCYGNR